MYAPYTYDELTHLRRESVTVEMGPSSELCMNGAYIVPNQTVYSRNHAYC